MSIAEAEMRCRYCSAEIWDETAAYYTDLWAFCDEDCAELHDQEVEVEVEEIEP